MMSETLRLLVVEDNTSDFKLLIRKLDQSGIVAKYSRIESLEQLSKSLASSEWDAALVDHNLPSIRFPDIMSRIHQHSINLPIIMVSGSVPEQNAIRLLEEGLWDYVSKDNLLKLPSTLLRAIELARTKRRLEQAQQELELVALAFESSDCILITDQHGQILRANKAFCDYAQSTREALLDKRFPYHFAPSEFCDHHDSLWQHSTQLGKWQGELEMGDAENGLHHFSVNITAARSGSTGSAYYIVVAHDISARKAAEEEIARLAFHDSLTGLPNRRMLIERLQLALQIAQRNNNFGALMFIDLDHFKNINDTLGHECGDALLVAIGHRLVAQVRANDMVARLGGDEFVIMLENLAGTPEAAAVNVQQIADKLREHISREVTIDENNIVITPSIGIAVFGNDEKGANELLRWADLAMYQAKNSGRNSAVFFDPLMQATMLRRATMEQDMRRAVARQEFKLAFQPKINRDGYVTGYEALIRWPTDTGMISPADFIPIAEDSGLILPLGDLVLEMACRQLKLLQRKSPQPATIAINVSLRQFKNPNFCDEIERRLDYFSIPPSLLMLELTESILADKICEVLDKMNRLKALGVRFSLDDFGTGYASLSYLKRLPFDQVKIDRSFVADILDDPNDASLVRAIIAMAHSLELEVIAEGIETSAQWELLLREGCDGGQGFLFSRPLLSHDLPSGKIFDLSADTSNK